MANKKKNRLEKLVEGIPLQKHVGRQRIAKGLYYDFSSNCFYFYTGKKCNKNGKFSPSYYIEQDPVRMEQFIFDYQKFDSKQVKHESALHTQETVKEYLDYFIECQRYSEAATKKYYELCKKRITKILGNIKLCDLTTTDCNKYVNTQLGKYSQATVRKDYDFLHMALNQAVNSRKIIFNPILAVTPPKTPSSGDQTGRIKYYSADDAYKIISECTKLAYKNKDNKFHNEDPNNIYAWAILLAIGTGARREEICGLKFSDFHANEKIPYVSITRARTDTCRGYDTKKYQTKGTKNKNSIRNIPIDGSIIKLFNYIQARYNENKNKKDNFIDSQFVISYSDGTVPHPGTISQKHKKILQSLGLSEILDFKALRHTFATLSRDGGEVTPFDLQDAMGHASVKTTEKYYLGESKVIKVGAMNSFKKMLDNVKDANADKNT